MALMGMITDPMLRQWVPSWVVEQYERANPFYKEVLTAMHGDENIRNYRALLKQTRQEMIRRHRRHLRRTKKKENAFESSEESRDESGVSDADSEADAEKQAQDLASKLAGDAYDDPNEERVELIREPRPSAGGPATGVEEDASWKRRSAGELLSAAGAVSSTASPSAAAAISRSSGVPVISPPR